MRYVMSATAIVLVITSACSDAAHTRIAVTSDTLIINGPQPVAISAHAVRDDGKAGSRARLAFSSNSDVVRLSSDGRVACEHAGDAVVAISSRASKARVVVLCRPILSFSPSGGIGALWVGGPPVSISMRAFDSAGKPVSQLRGTAQIPDETVARLVDGRVYPLQRGRTRVDMDFAGVEASVPVMVVDRVVHDSVQLVGGEMRSWRVSPGYYEVQLVSPRDNGGIAGLDLHAYHAHCARAPFGGGQHYFCILGERASIIVENSLPVGANSERDGELIVLRQP